MRAQLHSAMTSFNEVGLFENIIYSFAGLAVQASKRINNILKCAKFAINHASKVKLGSFHGAWSAEHNSFTSVSILQILMG